MRSLKFDLSSTSFNKVFAKSHSRKIVATGTYLSMFMLLFLDFINCINRSPNYFCAEQEGNIQYNHVIAKVTHGISLTGYVGSNVYVRYNTFEAPGPGGVYIITSLQQGYTPVILDNILK